MKTQELKIVSYLLITAFALFNLSTKGQLVESYWPLHDGDQRLFSVYGAPLTMSVSGQGNGYFEVSAAFLGSTQALTFEEDPDDCYMTGNYDFSEVTFDSPVLFMDDALLQKGGTVKTTTTLDGGLATVTITISVANAGTVTVPAGKFTNCRSVVLKVKQDGASSGVETLTSSSTTSIFAPGVGMIKTEVLPNVWAELESATIGGVFIGNSNIAPLTVQFGGLGDVIFEGMKGGVSSQGNVILLELGKTYTATANDVDGSVFTGWSDADGTALSSSPELTFTMQSNLVLEVNFIPNPFAAVAGQYIGLFMPDDGNTVQNSGYASFTITTKGTFSGYLQTGTTRHTLSGQLDANCDYTNTVNIPGEGSLTIGFNAASGYNSIDGTITSGDWSASLFCNQLVGGKVEYPGYGRYDILFADSYGNPYGSALMNFAENGSTTLAGTLGDGAKFKAASTFSPLADAAEWPFFAPLDGGKGCLLGWMDEDGYTAVSGNFTVISPAGGGAYSVSQLTASGQLDP
jgi:hypothetical protein